MSIFFFLWCTRRPEIEQRGHYLLKCSICKKKKKHKVGGPPSPPFPSPSSTFDNNLAAEEVISDFFKQIFLFPPSSLFLLRNSLHFHGIHLLPLLPLLFLLLLFFPLSHNTPFLLQRKVSEP